MWTLKKNINPRTEDELFLDENGEISLTGDYVATAQYAYGSDLRCMIKSVWKRN